MITRLKTAPTAQPISLEQAKQHLNIVSGWTEDDDVIKSHIKTATKKVQQWLRRKLITQTWYSYYDNWPLTPYFVLPFGNLQSDPAVSIKYTDTDGGETAWDTDDYTVDTNSDPGRIVLAYNAAYPSVTLAPMNPIQIEFVCGYGDASTDVEEMILHGIKLRVDDLYNNRGDVLVGVSAQNLQAVPALLWPYRIHEKPTQ